jgi:AAA+ superfamily predicted ATPase
MSLSCPVEYSLDGAGTMLGSRTGFVSDRTFKVLMNSFNESASTFGDDLHAMIEGKVLIRIQPDSNCDGLKLKLPPNLIANLFSDCTGLVQTYLNVSHNQSLPSVLVTPVKLTSSSLASKLVLSLHNPKTSYPMEIISLAIRHVFKSPSLFVTKDEIIPIPVFFKPSADQELHEIYQTLYSLESSRNQSSATLSTPLLSIDLYSDNSPILDFLYLKISEITVPDLTISFGQITDSTEIILNECTLSNPICLPFISEWWSNTKYEYFDTGYKLYKDIYTGDKFLTLVLYTGYSSTQLCSKVGSIIFSLFSVSYDRVNCLDLNDIDELYSIVAALNAGNFTKGLIIENLDIFDAWLNDKDIYRLVKYLNAQGYEKIIFTSETSFLGDIRSVNVNIDPQGASDKVTMTTSMPSFSSIGGLDDAKQEILMILKQMNRKQNNKFTRKGLILFGVPGSGKSLLAKGIYSHLTTGNNTGLFLSVKGPELLDAYVGESERKIRELFQKAADFVTSDANSKVCVIFFDEIDSLLCKRGEHGNSSSGMDRVVSTFLLCLDSIRNNIFVIGATNRVDLLDNSLMRPGRLDRIIYVGIQEDKRELVKCIMGRGEEWELEKIVKELKSISDNWTGADISGIYKASLFKAVKRKCEEIDQIAKQTGKSIEYIQGNMGEEEGKVKVSVRDILETIRETSPSVLQADLEKYEAMMNQFNSIRFKC